MYSFLVIQNITDCFVLLLKVMLVGSPSIWVLVTYFTCFGMRQSLYPLPVTQCRKCLGESHKMVFDLFHTGGEDKLILMFFAATSEAHHTQPSYCTSSPFYFVWSHQSSWTGYCNNGEQHPAGLCYSCSNNQWTTGWYFHLPQSKTFLRPHER